MRFVITSQGSNPSNPITAMFNKSNPNPPLHPYTIASREFRCGAKVMNHCDILALCPDLQSVYSVRTVFFIVHA